MADSVYEFFNRNSEIGKVFFYDVIYPRDTYTDEDEGRLVTIDIGHLVNVAFEAEGDGIFRQIEDTLRIATRRDIDN